MNLDELQQKIRETLSLFANVESAVQARRAQIDQWNATEHEKKRLHGELERVHQRAHEILVLRLDDLHSELLHLTMSGRVS
jgi:hypothetical protein